MVVCVSNAGRSQIAQAFLEKFSPDSEITSAGTDVGTEGKERDGFPLRPDIIAEAGKVGLDLRRKKRARLVTNLADWANDIIVIMTVKRQRNTFQSGSTRLGTKPRTGRLKTRPESGREASSPPQRR